MEAPPVAPVVPESAERDASVVALGSDAPALGSGVPALDNEVNG